MKRQKSGRDEFFLSANTNQCKKENTVVSSLYFKNTIKMLSSTGYKETISQILLLANITSVLPAACCSHVKSLKGHFIYNHVKIK